MSWVDRLERRLGRWGLPGLPLYIVSANALVYLFERFSPGLLSQLLLDPRKILGGEIWRLLTFLFVPPETHPILLFFWLYLLYLYGSALESEWGSFSFTLFYGVGALSSLAAAFILLKGPFTNVYLNLSLFLAFAALFPETELLIFFILPVKVKYLGLLSWLWVGYSCLMAPWALRAAIGLSLLNYWLFFIPRHAETLSLKWQVFRNRRRFRGGPQ